MTHDGRTNIRPEGLKPRNWTRAKPIEKQHWRKGVLEDHKPICSTSICRQLAVFNLRGADPNRYRRGSRNFCEACAQRLAEELRP